MAEEWLEEIYQDARVLTCLKEAVRLLHVGDDVRGCDVWNRLVPELKRICDRYERITAGAGAGLMQNVKLVVANGNDYLAFADAMEELLLPGIASYLSALGHIHVEEEGFEIESSEAGYLSLRDTEHQYLIHGLSDPMEDARVMAESIYKPEHREYCLLGVGLGYLAYQLYLLSEGSARIRVYETDSRVQFLAAHYGVFDWIPKENLYIERDMDILKFLCYVDEHSAWCAVAEWVLPFIPRRERPVIERLYMEYSVGRDVADTNFSINFWKNMEVRKKWVSDIPREDLGEDFIIVAAGPSLDQSMEFLRKNQGKMTVIAVGTVFRKLLNRGIEPDFVAVLESHELVYEQIQGLEEQKVPLIMPMCVYWKIAECYQGDIYFFLSSDCRNSIDYARENKLDLWGVGGTVAYQAMDAAVKLGARRVYLLGLDLAYPDAMSHAEGTHQRKSMEGQDLTPVEKVGGGQVYSDYTFSIYRETIEKFVQAYRDVEFYNLSRVGSRIKGTIELDPDNV